MATETEHQLENKHRTMVSFKYFRNFDFKKPFLKSPPNNPNPGFWGYPSGLTSTIVWLHALHVDVKQAQVHNCRVVTNPRLGFQLTLGDVASTLEAFFHHEFVVTC